MDENKKVLSIFIYPVKSCRGISVSHAPLTPTGFRWDRNWMVLNDRGRARTQRNEPRLALVEVELPQEAFLDDWEPTKDSYMVIKAPGMPVLKISLAKPQEISDGVSIWEWCGSALDEGVEAAKWFSDYLGKPSWLVRFNSGLEIRPVVDNYAPGHKVMFTDFGPYLVASQGSLDELNKHLKEPVSINRFRPSILIDGCEPFSEDLWKEVRINKFTFEGVKLCARCKIPTIDQETGVAGTEPNATLKELHSDKTMRPNKKQQGEVYFGHYLVWKDSVDGGKGNIIKVGDPVFLLQKYSSTEEVDV
ncbi:mitochondrial amidoxime-reducing component 1 [Ricinus communis]|uniref:mitochondrial amidoxime-reducing component 1 n=1 Tax=Ricinus communis TaxID=3988 RepID=UPI00201A98C6|nr:mitochondrial amidoxime-reducing component 1 [Ricinus communis]